MAGIYECTYTGKEKPEMTAESKEYKIKDIIDYLIDCTKSPQNDTKVEFEIDEEGNLTISTSNYEIPGYISRSDFPEA